MNTSSHELTPPVLHWGDESLPAQSWNNLDQLWLQLSIADDEFLLSHCYSEPGKGTCDQFGRLVEVRYPLQATLQLQQKLSPRPIVARPIQPIHLPAGGQVNLLIGTTLWLSLNQGSHELLDLPLARLSDTWFGPDTLSGEVCYACQTHARLSLAGIASNPYKAITPLLVKNESSLPLTLDRINLPLPNLALYQTRQENGALRYWTSALTLTNSDKFQEAEIKISREAPPECQDAQLLCKPRVPIAGGIVRKTLTFLLG